MKLSSKVFNFKKDIILSNIKEIKYETQLLDENGLIKLVKTLKSFDVVYPSIGENFSYLRRLIKDNKLNINYITREEDEFCWQFSNKGYFNFKLNIPKILTTFKLN